jgi:hypothetical protein
MLWQRRPRSLVVQAADAREWATMRRHLGGFAGGHRFIARCGALQIRAPLLEDRSPPLAPLIQSHPICKQLNNRVNDRLLGGYPALCKTRYRCASRTAKCQLQ